MELRGVVKSGVGEGSFFMGLEPYASVMEVSLGFRPYRGTLNIAADREEAESFIKSLKEIIIPGFKVGTKTFGAVHCYPCTLKNTNAAIIVPQFTRYDLSTVEIIAKEHLRTASSLKDGDEITLTEG
ncbi:MAG TPA: DUF120 domain-containing protein [Candidatus Nanoarchaeia archaeon]|nr:DUF120 domain-containing protein [Candidatus Nanoarchaeia archaeon]